MPISPALGTGEGGRGTVQQLRAKPGNLIVALLDERLRPLFPRCGCSFTDPAVHLALALVQFVPAGQPRRLRVRLLAGPLHPGFADETAKILPGTHRPAPPVLLARLPQHGGGGFDRGAYRTLDRVAAPDGLPVGGEGGCLAGRWDGPVTLSLGFPHPAPPVLVLRASASRRQPWS